MKNNLTMCLVISILLSITFVLADDGSIGTAKQNTTIQLTRVCDNCTYVNLTKIIYPNQTFALLGQFAMTKNGSNYNYSFSDTNTLGDYYYTTCGDLNGINNCETINFKVTPSGKDFTTSSSISTFIPTLIMLLTMLAFLFLGGMFSNRAIKWAFICLAAAFFVFAITYSITVSQETLSQYSSLSNWILVFLKVFSLIIAVGVIIIAVGGIIMVIKNIFDKRLGKAK